MNRDYSVTILSNIDWMVPPIIYYRYVDKVGVQLSCVTVISKPLLIKFLNLWIIFQLATWMNAFMIIIYDYVKFVFIYLNLIFCLLHSIIANNTIFYIQIYVNRFTFLNTMECNGRKWASDIWLFNLMLYFMQFGMIWMII